MEAANAYRNVGRNEWAGEVYRSWKLVRLDPDQRDHSFAALGFDVANHVFRFYSDIDLVEIRNLDIDVLAKNSAFKTIQRDSIEDGQRIGRDV
jgi:hypothetical protein